MFIALSVAIIPVIGYALFSLNNFQEFSLHTAESDLEQTVKSLMMLCEAQEALDRLIKGSETETDAISGASPSWRDGNEFRSLQGIIKGTRVAETGYTYVFDTQGSVIIHPLLESKNYYDMEPDEAEVFIRIKEKALAGGEGIVCTHHYPWPDDEEKIKTKIAKFIYFEPYDWIITVAAYKDEILRPYYKERNIFYYTIAATILLVSMLVVLVSRFLMRPVKLLTEATTQIAKGDLNVEVPAFESDDEIGRLARHFKLMIYELRHAHNDLQEWSKTLEQKVEERSNALKKVHERVLTAEKMASLGKLSAMVAHEINNPLSGILSYLKLSMKLMGRMEVEDENLGSIHRYLDISATEVKRVGDIVRNLLMFSKQSFGEFGGDHLNTIIDKSIALIKHTAKMKNITVQKEADEQGNDSLYCDSSGLQQMFMALSMNAIDAMEKGGGLTIKADYRQKKSITVQVIDTGKGIPDDVLPHIFEPFFSKKESKKSIGMGLSVVYGIVQAHAGSIQVESEVNHGTTFSITLSREKQAKAEQKVRIPSKDDLERNL